MEQNGQNNGYQYNMYAHGDPKSDNGIDFNSNAAESIENGSLGVPLDNTDTTMGIPVNTSAAMNNHDVALGVNGEGSNYNSLHNGTPSTVFSENKSPTGAAGSSHPSGARGMLGAHNMGPARAINSHHTTLHHPYSRPQSGTSQSQVQTRVRRNASRRAVPAVGMSQKNESNAYTLSRNQLNGAELQNQTDMSYAQGTMSASGHVKTSTSSTSLSPVGLNNIDTQTYTSVEALSAPGNEFVRPIHEKLDSTRLDPAGHEPHPNPDWRAPGPSQWTDILYDHTILVHLSDASIKDLMKHCERLVSSGVPDQFNADGPKLLSGTRYTVLDAQAAWDYCTAYSKRRQQLRNNSAANRSRCNKAAQMKHWKALALAAGASNRNFSFDVGDPANDPKSDPTLLAAVTQDAIAEMQANWAQSGGPGVQGPVANPPPDLILGQPQQPLNLYQMQPSYYDHSQGINPALPMAAPSSSTAFDTTSPSQPPQPLDQSQMHQSYCGPSQSINPALMAAPSSSTAFDTTSPGQPQQPLDQCQMQQRFYDPSQALNLTLTMAAPSSSTALDTMSPYQQNDVFEDCKPDPGASGDEFLDLFDYDAFTDGDFVDDES